MTLVNQLYKDLIPGSPGTPSSPPFPGSPGSPAYDLTVPVQHLEPVLHGEWVFDPKTNTYNPVGYFTWSVVTTYVTTHVNAVPGTSPQPGDPGTSATPNEMRIGWNSGAILLQSQDVDTHDAQFTFVLKNLPVGLYIGISSVDAKDNPNNIEWGIYIAGDTAYAVENGVHKAGPFVVSADSGFHIYVQNHHVHIDVGGSGFYDSTVDAFGMLYANACLYMSSDAVYETTFNSFSFYTNSGDVDAVLPGLQGFALDSAADPGGWTDAVVTPLVGDAFLQADFFATCAGVLTSVNGYAFNSTFHEDCRGVLPGISGASDAGPSLDYPNYAFVVANIPRIFGFALCDGANAGTVQGILPGLEGFALDSTANTGGYINHDRLTPIDGFAATGLLTYAHMELVGFGVGAVYRLYAQGHQDTDVRYGFFGELSGYSLSAFTGSQLESQLSGYQLTASGSVTNLAEASLALSGYSLMATGEGVQLGRAIMQLSGYSLDARTGYQAVMEFSGYALDAEGFGGNVGEAIIGIKPLHYSLVASGTRHNYGSVTATIPGVTMANMLIAQLQAPAYQLVAAANQVLSDEIEGYSHTILDDGSIAVTHYPTLPFDYIVRFGDKYFGLGDDGLYEITGNTMDGEAITATVESGVADFGAPELKRARHLYLNGRLNGSFHVDAIEAQKVSDGFDVTFNNSNPLGNSRVALGRGMQSRYLAFRLTNSSGQDFEIHEMGPEVDVLRRTA